MRKRPLPDGGHDIPMRRFKRPHSSTASSRYVESTDFYLNVLICQPQFGKYHHWALQLHNQATDDGTIFELQGAYPEYEFATYQCRPKYYPLKVLRTFRIWQFTLSSRTLESMAHAIENDVEVRNDSPEWNGQNFVLEVMGMLEDDWWLDENDTEYTEVKAKLNAVCGPIEEVQDALWDGWQQPRSEEELGEVDEAEVGASEKPKSARSVQFAENLEGD